MNCAFSRSASEMKPLANNDCLRSRSARASLAWIRARSACDFSDQDIASLIGERADRRVEVRLRLLHLEIEGLGVDPRQQLALLHGAVEVDEELLDLPGDLRPDGDRGHRRQRAGGRDHRGEGAALDLGQAEARRAFAAEKYPRSGRRQRDQHERSEHDPERAAPARRRLRMREACGGRVVGHRGSGVGDRSRPGRGRARPGQPFFAIACCSASSRRSARNRVSTTEA